MRKECLMQKTQVYYYQEDDGSIPFVDWLTHVEKKVAEKCLVRIELLKEFGNSLRRPYADYLRNGIYELRVSHKRIQYRILYFFYGKNVVLISHGLTKEQKVPEKDIDNAIRRKAAIEKNPNRHIFREAENGWNQRD